MDTKRKKILMMISSLEGGGAERVFVRIANALSVNQEVFVLPVFRRETSLKISAGVRVLDASRIGGRLYNKIIDYYSMIAHRFYKNKQKFFDSFFRDRMLYFISCFNRKERPDVTLSFLEVPNQFNARSLGVIKVMSERNNPLRKDGDYFERMCKAYSRADKVIFQSRTVMNMFPERIRKKGVVLPNPIEVSCGAVGGSKRIVSIGRLHPQKNQALLVRSFAGFSKDHPEHTLHIYGAGELEESLKVLIGELDLEGKVFLEGYVADVHEAVSDAQMFVLSSDYEGMPNCLLEAMMMGLPCVTTSFEGADEFFGGTGSCLMVPVGDEQALTEAMSRLADNEELRKELSSRGAELADGYSVEKVIPLWEKELFS